MPIEHAPVNSVEMKTLELNPKVLGQRLQVERKARGLTQQDLAHLLNVARTTIVAVEKGERPLLPEEMVRLGAAWSISISDLVRDRPAIEPLAPQLRAAAPSSSLSASDVVGVTEAAESLRRLSENYLELERLVERPLMHNYPAVYAAGAMPPSEAAADIAARERARLGLGDCPIPHLRSVLENEVGLRIFLFPMTSRLAGMFAFDATLGGLIALNSAHPSERRLWTLAHEYYHFLCDRFRADVYVLSGVSPRRVGESERLADIFAAHFLMPAPGLRRRFYDLKAAHRDTITPGDLLHLKRQYGVTFQALTLRLEELKLLRAGTWNNLKAGGFRVGEAEAMAGLPPREDSEGRLPPCYLELAVEAYDRAELSEGQLAKMLGCDRIEARRVVREMSREWDLSDSGEAGNLELDLDQPLAAAA